MMFRSILLLFILFSSLFGESNISLLTGIARDTIVGDLYKQKLINKPALLKRHPFLAKEGATFVTLNKDTRLRGCMGSLKAYRPLIDDLISNSRSAAFSDPRFMELQPKELSRLEVEVSLLTPPRKVIYKDVADLKQQIVVGKDGIVLETFFHKATYLPQVWESLPEFEQFFSFLCKKAGLSGECLEDHPDIYRYHVHKYSEDDLSRRPANNAALFYPKECLQVEHRFASFRNRAQHLKKVLPTVTPRAIIVPHAGYVFSGYTADLAYRSAMKSRAKRVIVIGPSHHLYFKGVSVSEYEAFETPCGILRNDMAYVQKLKKQFKLQDLKAIYEKEHSTEVQLPFINHYMPEKKVVELVYGEISPTELSKMLEYLLKDKENLLVISSDLSHFYTLTEAKKHDFICLDGVESVNAQRLEQGCEACGHTGIEALVLTAERMRLKSELLEYRTSADASGDKKRVVGYMSAVFW